LTVHKAVVDPMPRGAWEPRVDPPDIVDSDSLAADARHVFSDKNHRGRFAPAARNEPAGFSSCRVTERKPKMSTFEFSIIASGFDPVSETFEARFYDAGCDDATVSFQKGRIILDFAREAASIEAAVPSAIENVAKAGPSALRADTSPLRG